MARMLGRYRLISCGKTSCPHCAEDGAARAAKRIEQRDLARSLMPETDAEWLRTLGPLFADVGIDCQHGCNGSPCGSERCTFICHEDG